jgi:hypothetical protein
MRHPNQSPKGANNQTKKAGNARTAGRTAAQRKRRSSSTSVSSVSSVSSLEELSEESDDSEDDGDDEEDRPLARAPSYGRRQGKTHKAGRQPTQNKRRLVSDEEYDDHISSDGGDSDDSSDDIYAAVDYITDGDDEDRDVEKLEEIMIMESENEHRVLPTSEGVDWVNSGTFEDHMILPTASFFDEEHLYSAMDAFGETDFASEAVETPMPRRVHFEERSESSSDSDSHTDDEIPSDFLQQDSLDPQLRRMIESDNEMHRSHRRQSEELYGDADYGHGNIYHVESDGGSSKGSLSGYESMQADLFDIPVFMLIHIQPTMATLPMKTFRPRRPLPTPGPCFVGTRLIR